MNISWKNILIVLGVALFFACLWYFRSIIVYVLISGVLSIMGRPLVDLFCKIKVKIRAKVFTFPRTLSALLTLLIIWGIIITFFATFIPLLTTQINYFSTIDSVTIVQIIKGPIEKLEQLFMTFNSDITNQVSIQDHIAQAVSGVLNINMVQNLLGTAFVTFGSILVAAFSISFITFFFLKDQHLFFESILMWVPDKFIDNVTRALYSIKNLLTRYFIGIVIQSTCVFILITLGMTIIGIDFNQAIVMGVILAVLNVIPYAGPWIGLFIALIMGIASHINMDFNEVVVPLITGSILVVAITNLIDNVVFQPVIFSNSVRAHPLEIFIVVLASGFAAGIPGMILGIPTYTVLRVLAREFFYNFKAVQKITSGLSPENIEVKKTKKIFKKHNNTKN